jgi:hypothetical protein
MKKTKKAAKATAKPKAQPKAKATIKAKAKAVSKKRRPAKVAKKLPEVLVRSPTMGPVRFWAPPGSRSAHVQNLFSLAELLHDESEADEDGFIKGAGFDRYGGFEGDGLS